MSSQHSPFNKSHKDDDDKEVTLHIHRDNAWWKNDVGILYNPTFTKEIHTFLQEHRDLFSHTMNVNSFDLPTL